MAEPKLRLNDLRRGIDEIDTSIHDLLIRRSALVEEIAEAKGDDGDILRPGREAQIIRRLLARHKGRFPEAAVARIWREIISASIALQGPFTVALRDSDIDGPIGQLARAHFGAVAPILGQRSEGAVVQMVMEGRATVALLPLPGAGEGEPWWRFLAHPGETTPRIIARLPFVGLPSTPDHDALVIALADQEESGEDHSLLLLETREAISRTALKKRLDQTGFKREAQGIWDNTSRQQLHLVEVDGWVAAGDPRLRRLGISDDGLIEQLRVVGAFAAPLARSPAQEQATGSREETA